MASVERKSFRQPDEVREFTKGKAEMLRIGGDVIGRLTLMPGWKWSEHVKPIAGTDWCEAPHYQYQVCGRIHVVTRDGQEFESGPGEVVKLEAGHDAWVVGQEPVVLVDWQGARDYARQT
ncbi:MAG TPA: cupin domain-containing protein [Planctomycetota bacterium]|nr:cupin domain-containing protein [Planctomycetota bacterium]